MDEDSWTSLCDPGDAPQVGTEGGSMCADDLHGLGARVTMEKRAGEENFAITWRIYDWMMHACRFNTRAAAVSVFGAIKLEIYDLIAAIPLKTDPEIDANIDRLSGLMSAFCDRYPV
jgi:hypothetical protein